MLEEKMKVTVYTKEDCGACDTVKTFLEGNGIEPDMQDINEKSENMKAVKDLGFQGVPVVVTSNDSVPPFSGFDYNKLNQIVQEYQNQ